MTVFKINFTWLLPYTPVEDRPVQFLAAETYLQKVT